MGDLNQLKNLAEAATPGPWDHMKGRNLVRAIRDDLAVPLFEAQEPYSDPLLGAPTCRVGREVVFRANSEGARQSAAMRQEHHNAAFIAAANPETVLSLISTIERQAEEVARWHSAYEIAHDQATENGAAARRANEEIAALRERLGDD